MLLSRYLDATSERSLYYLARARRRRVINFLHVGKTGGTAVKAALAHAKPPDNAFFRFRKHSVRLCDVPKGEQIFFFLREPNSRFVSAFNSRQREGRPRYYYPWSPAERAAFSRFRSPDDLASSLSSANPHVRHAAEYAMHGIQHVGDSYYYWCKSEEYLTSRLDNILFIGFQETLAVDFDRLKDVIGLTGDLRLPDDDIAAHRSPSAQATMLSDQAQANLARWYARDRGFYLFCKEIAAARFADAGGTGDAPFTSGFLESSGPMPQTGSSPGID